jgi:hypothetical protein
LIGRGFGEQVTPAGKPAAGQVTFTFPVNPPLGVTVMVDIALAPAVAVTALPPTLKVPVFPFTVKLTLFEEPPPGVGLVTVTALVPADVISVARIEAVSCVALTKVVVFAAPAKFTVEVFTKFVPFTVSGNAAPPAVALFGAIVVIVGTGLLPWVIVSVGGVFKVGPPPGCGVNKSMGTTAAVVKSESGSFTVIDVVEQAVTFDRTERLKSATVPFTPQTIELPLTISEKFVVPVVVVVGLIELITGMGFNIVNGTAFVVAAGTVLVTVTEAAAPFCNWAAGMVAVQEVAVGQLVVNDVVVPFTAKFTTDVAVNPLPFTVKFVMLAAPAFAVNGEIDVMLKAAAPRFKSQTPRPWVAARSVRDAVCNAKPRICALGKEEAAPKGDQFFPPSIVKNAPISVPT